MTEIHDPESCTRGCKVHWYLDFATRRQTRYPMMAYYEVGLPIDGKRRWSRNIPVFCGPPAYYPKKTELPKVEETEKENTVSHQGIQASLVTYLQRYPNQVVTIAQMEEFFKDRFTRTQIMSNMGNLTKSPMGKHIVREKMGMWKYVDTIQQTEKPIQPQRQNAGRDLFEKVRDLSDDKVLQVDEQGDLWVAKKVNL